MASCRRLEAPRSPSSSSGKSSPRSPPSPRRSPRSPKSPAFLKPALRKTERAGSAPGAMETGQDSADERPSKSVRIELDPVQHGHFMSPPRLVFMGDGRIGTSSLIKRFNLGLYHPDYRPEVAKIMRHTKDIFHANHSCYVTVQFWDVEGSDMRTAMQCAHKAHAVAVVYDITNRSSFEKAQEYLDGVNPRASVLLIGNKMDLGSHRKVSFEEGRLLARIHRVEFVETSAKCNYNVDEAFHIMVNSIPEEYLFHKSSSDPNKKWKQATSAVVCALCRKNIQRHHDSTKTKQVVPPRRAHSDGEHSGEYRYSSRIRMSQAKMPSSSYHIHKDDVFL